MLEKELVSKVRNYAYKNSEKDDIHGFLHVERVYNLCLQIGEELGANLLVLKISALLHDIGRKHKNITPYNKNHAEISAEMALKFLKSIDFKISQNDIENIIHAIKSHSFSNNMIPRTLEAKILSDADKLDALGAIGLYRTIGFTVKNQGGIDDVIKHLETKIMKLNDQLYLELSKKIAKEKNRIVLEFYNTIKKEKFET
ncbi:MAG: HD domain-containing protein [Candidatus Hodarchaeota archaeon]